MGHRTAFLNGDALAALRTLLGGRLWQLYCPQLDVEGAVYRSYSFSIGLERMVEGIPVVSGVFLNVSVQWQETEHLYLDYWQLRVALSPQPERLPFDTARRSFGGYVSSVFIRPPALVRRIEVLQAERMRREAEHPEGIIYDHALRLTRADGLVVVIAAHRSINDFLDLSFDPATVASLTEECTTRVTIE